MNSTSLLEMQIHEDTVDIHCLLANGKKNQPKFTALCYKLFNWYKRQLSISISSFSKLMCLPWFKGH